MTTDKQEALQLTDKHMIPTTVSTYEIVKATLNIGPYIIDLCTCIWACNIMQCVVVMDRYLAQCLLFIM